MPLKKSRFRIKHVVGDAHGGPMELEQDFFWSVIDARTGKTVLEYHGEYWATYPNIDDEGKWSGVTDVRLAPDGRHVQVQVADGPLKTLLIPGAEKVKPLKPWRPPPEFPVQIGAVTIEEDTDLAALVNQALRGQIPKGAKVGYRNHPPLWICTLHEWLEPTSRGRELALAVAARIRDPKPEIRGAVLYFYCVYPFAPGFEAVVDLAQSDLTGAGATTYPALGFESLPGKAPLTILAGRLTRRRERRERPDALDRRALRLLQEAITRPDCPWPEPVRRKPNRNDELRLAAFSGLLIAPTWLARNIVEIEKARPAWPGRWEYVLRALGGLDRYKLLGVAAKTLLDSKRVPRRELGAWAKKRPYWETKWPEVLRRLARSIS